MRSRSLLVLVMVLTLLPSPARAQSVGVYAMDSVEAWANWVIDRSQGSIVLGFINVGRYTDPVGATDTVAIVGKVRCRSKDRKGTWISNCVIKDRVRFIDPHDFQFDMLLRSAKVVIRDAGGNHSALWTAKEDAEPQPGWMLQGGERSLVARASLGAPAKVSGRVLGMHFSTKKNQAYAGLRRGIEGGVIFELTEGQRDLRITKRSRGRSLSSLLRAPMSSVARH